MDLYYILLKEVPNLLKEVPNFLFILRINMVGNIQVAPKKVPVLACCSSVGVKFASGIARPRVWN
jgi:hypothetical protein